MIKHLTIKRIQDCMLIALTSPLWLPLMVVISIWIKMVSRGSVLFKQERVGKDGSIFSILKFRSMHAAAGTQVHSEYYKKLVATDVPMVKLDSNDTRIIPGGKLLRALGLDELPQLFNVAKGDMSLVGPRPCTLIEHELFTEEQKARVSVLPGLTGYWQVCGKNRLTFTQMITLDLQYARQFNTLIDLVIIIATIPAMLLQYVESKYMLANELHYHKV